MKIASDDRVVLNHLARSHLLMCHDEYEVAVQQGRTVAAMLASAAHVYKHVACLAMASHVCVCASHDGHEFLRPIAMIVTPNAGLGIGCPCFFVC